MTDTTAKRRVTIDDYDRLRFVAELDAAPDGTAAYTVRRWSDGAYQSEIRVVAPSGAARTVRAGQRSVCPRFSPRGGKLAFIADGKVYLEKDGAEPILLYDGGRAFTVTECAWRRDGAALIVCGYRVLKEKTTPAAWKDAITAENGQPIYKESHGGIYQAREYRLEEVTPDGEKRTILTSEKAISMLSAGEDGRLMYSDGARGGQFVAREGDQTHALGCLPVLNGGALDLGEAGILCAGVTEELLGLYGMPGPKLFCLRRAENGYEAAKLENRGDVPDEVLPLLTQGPFAGSCNGKMCKIGARTALVTGAKQGLTAVYRVEVGEDAMEFTRLTDGRGTFAGLTQGGERVYALYSDCAHPFGAVEIHADGAVHALREENEWLSECQLAKCDWVSVPSLDGCTRITGLVMLPEGEKIPAVVLTHGGPTAFYSDRFNLEAQLLAARGMAVLMPNPRGSSGHGDAHATNSLAYDGTAAGDVLYFMDKMLLKYPRLDADRLGAAGGSYGGYMTAWLAGHSARFKATVVMRGLLNFQLLALTSEAAGSPGLYDSPRDFEDWMLKYVHESPTSYADKVNAPMLILHGEADTICPVDGAHMLYVGVRDTHPDLPVKMILFPGVGHNIMAANLDFYKRYDGELVAWMDKYLKEEA